MTTMAPVRTWSRQMTIQQALEWSFATECASIEFDEIGSKEFERPSCDIITVIQRRGELGCTVDGGGQSDPHHDAQIIAAAVEAMPKELGGKRMAALVAECARSRRAPDWSAAERLGVVPQGWDFIKGAWMAFEVKTQVYIWRDIHRNKREFQGTVCPISYIGTAADLGARRRAYLGWCGALMHLHAALSREGVLLRLSLLPELPSFTPWIKPIDGA